ncbi:WRKY domain-containing protein [Cephalotus follicularis]|uniref:WRKY domain-containing protein n=1 Tax=Cephalotus follicularis TaxID=3775 RepID=A0A1Q3B1R7_CEPFO|nr:WRKY domain-containing protein [Cephalotus follicularis]
MGEKEEESSTTRASQRPTITLPPRPSMDSMLFAGGFGLSPGPLTMVSSFFSDNYPDSEFKSFSQLLAGAMASPRFNDTNNSMDIQQQQQQQQDANSKDAVVGGFKMSRPMNLVVARSPLFTVPPGLSPSGFFSPQSPFGMSHQQALAQVTAQAVFAQSQMRMQPGYQPSSVAAPTELTFHPSFTPDEASEQQMLPSTSETQGSTMESSEVSHSDRKYQPPIAVIKPADDGYNWRKYGQKPIKGSEYPRSYYKCTYLNCPVKKKVERSSDGQITEIIYKGQHNHEQPQPNRRAKDGSDLNGNINSQAKFEHGSQGPAGNLNKSSESRWVQESIQVAPAQSRGSSDSEEVGDVETIEQEGDDDEPNPKRRNTAEASEGTLSHKTVTEPKIIVQTRSEVDLLDDGYRWRKYGQKVVKGNPHPRSYYKCTSTGCNVRKHVERASTDPKAVITTYEGKHNHDVPAARNSSHNASHSNAPLSKPHKVMAEKHPLLKGMAFGNSDQRPVLLQLKEEQIKV